MIRRRLVRFGFWAFLVLLGPGIWLASYWHEFFVDASVLDAHWLCMTVASGRLTVSYNGDDQPPMHSGKEFLPNPYMLHEGMGMVRRIHMQRFRAETETARSTLKQRLSAEGTSEESKQAIRSRLADLDAYVADREKENAAWRAEQRRQASHWLNDEFGDEMWYLERTSTPRITRTGPDFGFILHVHLIVPLGLMCVAAIVTRRILRRRRARREREGLCKSCGYNLTGNISGVCPECGTAVPASGAIPQAAPAQQL